MMPSTLLSIGYNAFSGCSNLETVSFGTDSNLTTIGSGAFDSCTKMKLADNATLLPDTITEIGRRAFIGCRSLELTDIPSSVVTIGELAFSSSGLTGLTLPNSIKSIGVSAFQSSGIPAVTWPNNPDSAFTSIPQSAFEGTAITSVSIPSYITSIGAKAFKNTGLTALTLPSTVTSLGSEAFSKCANLTELSFNAGVTTIPKECFAYSGLTSVTIPSLVRTIGEMAFFDCTELTSLTIEDGVEEIGRAAFQDCPGLWESKVVVPASVEVVRGAAFGLQNTGGVVVTSDFYQFTNENIYPKTFTGNPGTKPLIIEFKSEPESLGAFDADQTYDNDVFSYLPGVQLIAPKGGKLEALMTWREETYVKSDSTLHGGNKANRFIPIDELVDDVYYNVLLPEASGVEFTVKQDGKNLEIDGATNSAQAISGKDVAVFAHKEGFYDQIIVKLGADFTADWTVALGEWEELPVSGKLLVNITKDGLPTASFDGLSFTLKNGSSDVSFTASYPYLVLEENHGLSADTNLTLTVTPAPSMQACGGTASSTLLDGSFSANLTSWGKAAITATGTTSAPCVVVLFDSDGNAVSSGTTSVGVFTSEPLPAGSYTVIAYDINNYFGAVGSINALSVLGLTAGDYAQGSVTVEDGGKAELALSVPKLNTSELTSILDTEKCGLTLRTSWAVTGTAFDMQVNYALKTGNTAERINFTLPAGASILYVYDGNAQRLTVTGNAVTVNSSTGTLFVSMKCETPGINRFGVSVTAGGKALVLGSCTVTVNDVFIQLPDDYISSRDNNRVDVYAKPNTPVSLTISKDEAPISGTTNTAGHVTMTYSLPTSTTYGQSFMLTAAVDGSQAKEAVTYLPAAAQLDRFGFYQCGVKTTVIDNVNPSMEKEYYTYYALGNEKSKVFTFFAEFKSDENLDITAIITMQDGSVRSVPMTLTDASSGIQYYTGELYFDNNDSYHVFHAGCIPEGFELIWDSEDTVELDPNIIYEQAMAESSKRVDSWQAVRDDIDNEILNGESLALTRNELRAALTEVFGEDADFEAVLQMLNDPYTPSFFGYSYRIVGTELFENSLVSAEEYNAYYEEVMADTELSETEKEAAIAVIEDHKAYQTGYISSIYKHDSIMDEAAAIVTEAVFTSKFMTEYPQ